jgi:HD-GYP domain-containing protein (c-di-GMP phosphodiesterase class II)
LYDHCVNVALLSMTVASQLGLDPQQMNEVGLGAMLQDIGMVRVPDEIRLAERPLSDNERLEIEHHPIYTLNYLENIRGLPPPASFVGYQVHERLDGSGYPRRRSGMLIHLYAKIVGVVDTYSAMISSRPYRPAMLPYEAARKILIEGSRDKFDRAVVRAFLDSMSLFPVASHVQLSNGNIAKVIRAVPGAHTRPVVEVVDAEYNPTGQIVDLSLETKLKVVHAVASPTSEDEDDNGPTGLSILTDPKGDASP